MRVAIYARYSSDNQRDASIEDQLAICREHAEREGWTVVGTYKDRAISGASLIRPGIQSLLTDAMNGKIEIVLAEALDRLSRDQEDIAGIYKRMSFAGVKIITLSEGEVSNLHIGLKGTMNAMFLQDLADKTRRGLRGRVERGKSGGGNSYGYAVVKTVDANGEIGRGERNIIEAEAEIIRRICREYADGVSPRKIAHQLNAEGVTGPRSNAWGPSTIHGSAKRGNGILNNELYIGRIVWNRQRFIKDPDTGKRVSRMNPESEWVIREVPELRILDQDLWERVKERQASTKRLPASKSSNKLNNFRRPHHLFSGLIRCGACGGGYSVISQTHLGCSTQRNKGTCDNGIRMNRKELENRVLQALRHSLMDQDLFAEFCEEFTREINRLRMGQTAALAGKRAELKKVGRDIRKIIEAVKDGLYQPSMKEEMDTLESRKAILTYELETGQESPTLLHPKMSQAYREKLDALYETLNREDSRAQAADLIRVLIDEIRLIPVNGELAVELKGDLAGILTLAGGRAKSKLPGSVEPGSELSLVAGARCQLYLLFAAEGLMQVQTHGAANPSAEWSNSPRLSRCLDSPF